MLRVEALVVFLAAALSVSCAQDPAAETEAVRVEFMGSSGGMKVFNLNDASNFLMVQQDELLEVDAAGDMVVPPNRMRMAGGNAEWSPLEAESTGGRTNYNTRFTKSDSGTTFGLTAHVARDTVSTSEEVPCSGCSSGAGVCIDPASEDCTDKKPGPPSVCPDNYRECTEPIELTKVCP